MNTFMPVGSPGAWTGFQIISTYIQAPIFAIVPIQGYNKDTADVLRQTLLEVGDASDGLEVSVQSASYSAAAALLSKSAAASSQAAALASKNAAGLSETNSGNNAAATGLINNAFIVAVHARP